MELLTVRRVLQEGYEPRAECAFLAFVTPYRPAFRIWFRGLERVAEFAEEMKPHGLVVFGAHGEDEVPIVAALARSQTRH
ncbi:MAG TPA: hypothetical protein VFN70_05815 [Burkholderiales bacterium]|nr:hypothetical protein [Burkholderiales bacterium]